MVTRWSFAWRAASRFVAGETLDDAIRVVQGLNQAGIQATLDHLGEHISSHYGADKATKAILEIIHAIHKTGIRSNVSIKLSQIGMALGEEVCDVNLRRILELATKHNIFVRIDMEDSSWVDFTLGLYRKMFESYGLQNTGVVIQSYLYRSEQDICALGELGTKVRLCKGAYKEPQEVAYQSKRDVDDNYDRLAKLLIDQSLSYGMPKISEDGHIPPIPAIASHDPRRLIFAKQYAQEAGLPKDAIEFQMLYGIRRDLQEETAKEGYPVRVYVPFGTEWYPYFVRRLAERPANLWFFISNFFRK